MKAIRPINVKKSLQSLEDAIYRKWDEQITQNRKLVTFKIIKESHDCESYITSIDDRYRREYISMIRLSCHPLKIARGRYKKIP